MLVLSIGIELILEEVWKVEISDILRFLISVAIILGALAYAHSHFLQRFRFVLVWLTQGIGIVNEFVDWIIAPFRGLGRAVMRLLKPASKTTTA